MHHVKVGVPRSIEEGRDHDDFDTLSPLGGKPSGQVSSAIEKQVRIEIGEICLPKCGPKGSRQKQAEINGLSKRNSGWPFRRKPSH